MEESTSPVPSHVDACFTWDYAKGARPRLARLYEKAKHSMWDAEDLPWEIEIDQEKVAMANAVANPFHQGTSLDLGGTPFEHWAEAEWLRYGCESQNWMLSQFLHGEQGAFALHRGT